MDASVSTLFILALHLYGFELCSKESRIRFRLSTYGLIIQAISALSLFIHRRLHYCHGGRVGWVWLYTHGIGFLILTLDYDQKWLFTVAARLAFLYIPGDWSHSRNSTYGVIVALSIIKLKPYWSTLFSPLKNLSCAYIALSIIIVYNGVTLSVSRSELERWHRQVVVSKTSRVN